MSEDEISPNRKFLTAADKDNLFTIDHFPLWYRLAVENTPGSFFFYAVNDKGLSLTFSIYFYFDFFFLMRTSNNSVLIKFLESANLLLNVLSSGGKYVLATTSVTVSSEGKTAMAGGECHGCSSDSEHSAFQLRNSLGSYFVCDTSQTGCGIHLYSVHKVLKRTKFRFLINKSLMRGLKDMTKILNLINFFLASL